MTPLCLDNAHYVLQITKHFAPDPDITQTFNDTLMIDWEVGRKYLLLEVGDKKFSATYWNDGPDENSTYEGPFSYKLITLLKNALREMYPEYVCH